MLELTTVPAYKASAKVFAAIATDGKFKCHIHFGRADATLEYKQFDVVFLQKISSTFAKPMREIYGTNDDPQRIFTITSPFQALVLKDQEFAEYDDLKDLIFPSYE
uniref:Uncharacterized protein n=1 Tax=Panagrolaimus superbus TaxID=310955 RepID=A0A914YL20_9BILA